MNPGTRIDYKTLRRINPEAVRQAVMETLWTALSPRLQRFGQRGNPCLSPPSCQASAHLKGTYTLSEVGA